MKECLVEGKCLPEAYHKALKTLCYFGDETTCNDWGCSQIECSMTMVVNEPLSEPRISKLSMCYPEALEQYRQEMLDGILDFEIDRGKWKYTYHDRIFRYETVPGIAVDQIEFIIDELKRNPSSRRAVIDVRLNAQDMYSDDPACLQHIQYFIRDNKLDCKVIFRSNDATRATFMNAFALIELQANIAKELGVEVGQYVHRANSFHCYEAEYNNLKNYVTSIEEKSLSDLTYEYEGFWKEEMEASRAVIEKKVEGLRKWQQE